MIQNFVISVKLPQKEENILCVNLANKALPLSF